MPEPKGMKGDILGENDILGADTVTLGLTNGNVEIMPPPPRG